MKTLVELIWNHPLYLYCTKLMERTHCDGNTINLFADDMLLYRVIGNAYDMELVQQGIDNVYR